FSSRRRHTRSKRDWSSDVCSSDLMFISVLKIVLFPVFLGVVARTLLTKQMVKLGTCTPLVSVIAIVLILAAVVAVSKDKIIESEIGRASGRERGEYKKCTLVL